MANKKKDYLYRLLYSALIQIRADAHQEKNKKLFWIADLLHNLPLELSSDNPDFDDLFDKLEKVVHHNQMEAWFKQEIDNIDTILNLKEIRSSFNPTDE